MAVVQVPPIVVPAPVVTVVPAAGLPGWVAPVAGLIGVLLGVYLSRSREHQRWIWEKRVELYDVVRGAISGGMWTWDRSSTDDLPVFRKTVMDSGAQQNLLVFGSARIWDLTMEFEKAEQIQVDNFAAYLASRDEDSTTRRLPKIEELNGQSSIGWVISAVAVLLSEENEDWSLHDREVFALVIGYSRLILVYVRMIEQINKELRKPPAVFSISESFARIRQQWQSSREYKQTFSEYERLLRLRDEGSDQTA